MYSFFSSFSPVSRILAALTTTTKSPASRCGERPGLVFPRSTEATRDARRPRTLPSASATYQRRAARAASVLRLLVVRVIDIGVSRKTATGPADNRPCRGPARSGVADETRTRELLRVLQASSRTELRPRKLRSSAPDAPIVAP